jgi:hypothetical protein
MAFAGPAEQSRLTVFFRLIMLIPQVIVLYFVGLAAEIIGVIGWFGALFTGRLPGFAADFLAGYLRWQSRVTAYGILLTGQYPPYTLDDADYPVRLAVTPGRLNRLAVFFRLVLAIPAAIVLGLLAYGAFTVVLFVAWLIVLIRGSMPVPLHQAYCAALRYHTRFYAYFFMLTAEYPSGLFGDTPQLGAAGMPPVAPEAAGPPDAPADAAPQTLPYASDQVPPLAYGSPPQPYEGQPQPYEGQAFGYGAPAAAGWPMAAAPQWPLVLSTGAKRLVGMFLGLGVLLVVVYVILFAVVLNTAVSTATAINDSTAAYATFSSSASSFATTTTSCQSQAQPLPCVTAADRQIAQALGTFAQSIRNINMPTAASSAAAGKLASAATQAQQALQQLGGATSVGQYQQIIQSTHLQDLLNQVDQDYLNLGKSLGATTS